MKNKVERIQKIKEIISSTKIESQGQLLDILIENIFDNIKLPSDFKSKRIIHFWYKMSIGIKS